MITPFSTFLFGIVLAFALPFEVADGELVPERDEVPLAPDTEPEAGVGEGELNVVAA